MGLLELAAALAAACEPLMTDAALSARLTREAHALFHRAYSVDALDERIRAW